MITELVLGVASLFMGATDPFFEQVVVVPGGESVIKTEQKWNAVTLFSKDGAPLPAVEYWINNEFEPWHPAEYGETHVDNALDLVIFDDLQSELRLKVPRSTEVVLHFFNTERPGEDLVAQFDEVSTDFLEAGYGDTFKGKNLPKFFTRADWRADESLRVQTFVQRFFKPQNSRWYAKEAQAVEPRYRPVVKQTKTANGKTLFWPISENPRIFKFIVHHTGEAVDSTRKRRRTPSEIMRAIYYYHTVTRGWGDIGYNYVVDKEGNIYEGRAGGPQTVGAHTAYHNVGSIGISLMGNFEYENPTEAQINVLALLLADHARRFDVDPMDRSRFLGNNSFNVSGHRDVARIGHGTSCPGRNLVVRLPEIRTKTANVMELLKKFEKDGVLTTRDFLQSSAAAQKYLKDKTFKLPEKKVVVTAESLPEDVLLSRGKSKFVEFVVRNNTGFVWERGAIFELQGLPEGMLASGFRLTQRTLSDSAGKIRGKIQVKSTENGNYYLSVWPKFLEKRFFASQLDKVDIAFPVKVSGSSALAFAKKMPLQSNSFTKTPTIIKKSADFFKKTTSVARPTEPRVKVKIAGFAGRYVELSATATIEFWDGNKKVVTVLPNEPVVIRRDERPGRDFMTINTPRASYSARTISLKNPKGIVTLRNYEHPTYGYGRTKYNKFRGDFSIYIENTGDFLLVNELPLETYLAGLGEQPSGEPTAKKHAIHILARSYAFAYMGERRKFQTNKYDLEDDPRTSQLYLGYDWERLHVNQKNLLKKTQGRVLTYQGKVVIGPYFTQSAGGTSDKWRTIYPWTKAQKLPADEGLPPLGHGVGMSGNTARVLAEQGKSYQEIIDYFFDGVKVLKRY